MDRPTTASFAVVTGASSGIGYELAAQFAQHGYDVLIVAENDEIKDATQRLATYGTQVRGLRIDLARRDGVEELWREIGTSARNLDAIAINAGVGVNGPFIETDLERHFNLIGLNVTSAVHLTYLVLREMVARNSGRILITSSIAATTPGPFQSTYNASKAFLKSFAEAIRNEVKDTKVSITTLMPGATETPFFERAGALDTKVGASEKDDPAEVASQGFEAMMDGKDHVVAGSFKNKLQTVMAHVMPDPVVAETHRKQSEPGSASK